MLNLNFRDVTTGENCIRIVTVLIRIRKFLSGERGYKYYLLLISKQGKFFKNEPNSMKISSLYTFLSFKMWEGHIKIMYCNVSVCGFTN